MNHMNEFEKCFSFIKTPGSIATKVHRIFIEVKLYFYHYSFNNKYDSVFIIIIITQINVQITHAHADF